MARRAGYLILNHIIRLRFMSEVEIAQMRAKIIEGLLLARQRLIEKTKRDGGELVIFRDGEVVRIKADEL